MGIFEVKLTFEMLTMRGQRHTSGFSWESVKVFETQNVSTWGRPEPPTFGFMPNALTHWAIRARHLLSRVVEYWLWWYRYLWSIVNNWNVNCVRATAFIFDTRTGVLGKVSKFLRQKCLDLRGTRTPNLRIHANALTYRAIRARHLLGKWTTRIYMVNGTDPHGLMTDTNPRGQMNDTDPHG